MKFQKLCFFHHFTIFVNFENFWQISIILRQLLRYLEMILTYFLFFSFISMLSKSENDYLEGKSSQLHYFFSGANRGKIGVGRVRADKIFFPAVKLL